MTTAPKRFFTTLAMVLAVGAAVATAHQPYESSAHARLGQDGLELTVITSLEIAGQMVGDPSGSTTALEALRPQLVAEGAGLYEVTADGRRLDAERVFFTIRGGEAVFSAIFPVEHAANIGFRAAYLDKLPVGYGGSIEVTDEAGKLLGLNPLLKKGRTKDSFALPVTALVSAPAPSAIANGAAPASPSATEAIPTAVERKGDVLWPLMAVILVVYLLAVCLARRFQKTRN